MYNEIQARQGRKAPNVDMYDQFGTSTHNIKRCHKDYDVERFEGRQPSRYLRQEDVGSEGIVERHNREALDGRGRESEGLEGLAPIFDKHGERDDLDGAVFDYG